MLLLLGDDFSYSAQMARLVSLYQSLSCLSTETGTHAVLERDSVHQQSGAVLRSNGVVRRLNGTISSSPCCTEDRVVASSPPFLCRWARQTSFETSAFFGPIHNASVGTIKQRTESAKKEVFFMSGTTATEGLLFHLREVCCPLLLVPRDLFITAFRCNCVHELHV